LKQEEPIVADYTPEQIEEMRAAVAAADAKKAEEAAAIHAAYLAPVKTLCESAAYREVAITLQTIVADYVEDNSLNIHVNALAEIMPRLAGIIGVSLTVPAAPVAPAPEGDTNGE
jgi:hypothetical protein